MELLVARKTAVVKDGRRSVKIRKGTVVNADDPIVRGREHMFGPLAVKYLGRPAPRAVETATAGPGELRGPVLPPAPPTPEDPSASAPYDPSGHTVAQVNDYLAGVGLDERARVIQAECEGQSRRGIIQGPYSDLTGA